MRFHSTADTAGMANFFRIDTGYVLSCFGPSEVAGRRNYSAFIQQAGWDQGRMRELTGGGLVRSLGG